VYVWDANGNEVERSLEQSALSYTTSLDAAGVYTVGVYATNGASYVYTQSECGAVNVTVNEKPVIAATITTFDVSDSNIGIDTVTVSGQISFGTDEGVGNYDSVGIQYGVYASEWIATIGANLNADGTFTATIPGLYPETTYAFRAVARNAGTQKWLEGNVVTATTLAEIIVPPVVQTKDASDVTTTSAILHGTLTNAQDKPITSYGFAYSANGIDFQKAKEWTGDLAENTEVTYTLEGLTAGTQYSYYFYAVNAGGESAHNVVTFTTQNEQPVAPVAVTMPESGKTADSATLNGKITSDGGTAITEWGFAWKKSDALDYHAERFTETIAVNEEKSFLLEGLEANTEYKYYFYAVNSAGEHEGSEVTFTTLPAGVTAPTMSFTMDKTSVAANTESVKFTFTMNNANAVIFYADGNEIMTIDNDLFAAAPNVYEWTYTFNAPGAQRKIQFKPVYRQIGKEDVVGSLTEAQYLDVTAYLTVDGSTTLNAYKGGGDGTPFNVSSNMKWTATSDVAWIQLTADVANGKLAHHYDQNRERAARTGHITVSAAGCADVVITVIQDAYEVAVIYSVELNPKSGEAGQRFTLTATTNTATAWLYAVNNTGTPLRDGAFKHTGNTADGKKIWTASYTADVANSDRYWKVTPFNEVDVDGAYMSSNHISIKPAPTPTPTATPAPNAEYRIMWYLSDNGIASASEVENSIMVDTADNQYGIKYIGLFVTDNTGADITKMGYKFTIASNSTGYLSGNCAYNDSTRTGNDWTGKQNDNHTFQCKTQGTFLIEVSAPDGGLMTVITVTVGDEYEYISGYDVGIDRPTKVKVLKSSLEAWGWDKNNLKDNAQAQMWYRIQVYGASDFVDTEFFCEQLLANKSLAEYWDSLAEYKENGGENDVIIDYIYGSAVVYQQQAQAIGQAGLNMASDAINSFFSSIGDGIEWLSMSEDERKNKELAEQILKTLESKASSNNTALENTLDATSSVQKLEGFAEALDYAIEPLSNEGVAAKIAEALDGTNIRGAKSPKAVFDFYNSIMVDLGDGKTVKSVAEILGLSENTPQGTVNAIRQMLDYLKRTGDVSEYSAELANIAKGMGTEGFDKFLKALGDGQGEFTPDGFGFGVDACIGLISLHNEITTKNALYDDWYSAIEKELEQMDTDSEYYKAIKEVLDELYTYSGNDFDSMAQAAIKDGTLVFADAAGSAVISAGIKCVSAPAALAVDGAQIILALGNNDGKVSELSSLPESVDRFRDQRDKVQGLLQDFVSNPTPNNLNVIKTEVNTLYNYIYYAQENAYRYEEEVYGAILQWHIGDHPKEGLSYYRNLVNSEMTSLKSTLEHWGFTVNTLTK